MSAARTALLESAMKTYRLLPVALLLAMLGCSTPLPRPTPDMRAPIVANTEQEHSHRGADDLLTAGLGAAGLRSATPPVWADPERPSYLERRQRAIWTNWRGIADLSPGGGYGEVYGTLAPVPGREFHALAKVPGARQPHKVMLQLPDAFDLEKRCVVLTASSGSRGIYGAIALAGAWGLPRGCAVAYTDKGAGTDYVDTSVPSQDEPARLAFSVSAQPAEQSEGQTAPIAVKHAHSTDNPEADWGVHLRQAGDFALAVLSKQFPEQAPFTYANTRVIAVGLSNAGGAVLRAAESPEVWLRGVVAIAPNVWPQSGGRALYDYATEAALWLPCALNAAAFDNAPMARPGGVKPPLSALRCASLHALGWLKQAEPQAQAEEAYGYLRAQGWSVAALASAAFSTNFDMWRSVSATYASAYARRGAAEMPCGFAFHAVDSAGKPRTPTSLERAAWSSDASGIPPGAGVALVDRLATGADPTLPGLRCLRALWEAPGEQADIVRASIAATRAGLPHKDLPVLLMHGLDDGLIVEPFGTSPYAAWATAQARNVRYWKIQNAQHFDTFLGLPPMAARYLPLLPYAYRGLDAMWAHIADGAALPGDAEIVTTPRQVEGGVLAPLRLENLGQMP